jgi:hypothetical protein
MPEEPAIDERPFVVETISVDGAAQPGGVVTYRFRVTNVCGDPIVVRLSTANTLAGWSSWIAAPVDHVELGASAAVDIDVELKVPFTARRGDENETFLIVTLESPPG